MRRPIESYKGIDRDDDSWEKDMYTNKYLNTVFNRGDVISGTQDGSLPRTFVDV